MRLLLGIVIASGMAVSASVSDAAPLYLNKENITGDCSPPPASRSGGGLEYDRLASEDPADGGERAQVV
jgi:hypothetical protein